MNDYSTLYRLAHRVTTLYEKLKMSRQHIGNRLLTNKEREDIFENMVDKLLSKIPASRSTDNAASYRAEELQNASGVRGRNQRLILDAFLKYPMTTTKELSYLTGLDRYMVARRAPDLYPVYLDRVDGPQGYRWFVRKMPLGGKQ